jgi:hypothetical protein
VPFANALAAFRRGDLDAAEQGMREADALRPGGDGPSRFYRDEIERLRTAGLSPAPGGVITFSAK